jgi:DNA-binding response OmpR family regulator
MSSDVARVLGRILVIDDDRSARLLLERVLARAGHDVTLVDTAEEGLAKLEQQTYDLLITDKNLPGIDGLEVLRVARQKNPLAMAILITGFPNEATRKAASELGVFTYLTKPFGVHDIVSFVDAAVRAAKGNTP